MSYGLRNTFILLLVFVVIAAAGWFYLYFVQKSTIEELELSVSELETEYSGMVEIADRYDDALSRYERATGFIENFDKTLFESRDPDRVFKYLSEINVMGPSLEFGFVFNEISEQDQYGIIRTSISGTGSYNAVYHFINRIEYSRPVQKIEDLLFTPINQPEEYGNVNFSFSLNSYYTLTDYFVTDEEDLHIVLHAPDQFSHPFFPLIRTPEPNVDNLTDVENSRLIGVGNSRVFLRDQNGDLVNLGIDDPVYLGTLESIDVQNGRVTFNLFKGGIVETVTLEVQ